MKKIMQKIMVAAAVAATVFALNVHAATFRESVSMNAGSGTYTVASVYNAVASGARIEAVFFAGTTAPYTNTMSYAIGGVTNAHVTKAGTATDRTQIISNLPSLFIGDKVVFTSSDTNAHTIYIVGEEF